MALKTSDVGITNLSEKQIDCNAKIRKRRNKH